MCALSTRISRFVGHPIKKYLPARGFYPTSLLPVPQEYLSLLEKSTPLETSSLPIWGVCGGSEDKT